MPSLRALVSTTRFSSIDKIICGTPTFLIMPILAPSATFAGARNRLFNQGFVTDKVGKPLTGEKAALFRLYDQALGGNILWEEKVVLKFSNGVYTIDLGAVEPFPTGTFDQENLHLALQIEGDTEMTPRLGLVAVPWAQQSEFALTAKNVANRSVTANAIAPGVITSIHIKPGALGSTTLAPTGVTAGTYSLATITVDTQGRITTAAGGAIAPFVLGAGSIKSEHLAAGAVGATALDTNAVETAKIVDSAVNSGKIASSAVTATKIASGAVGSSALSADSVDSSKIADGTITTSDLGAAAGITDAQINDDLTISGGTINSTPIGATTTSTGAFTTLTAATSATIGGGSAVGRLIFGTCSVDPPNIGNGDSKNATVTTTSGCTPSFSAATTDVLFMTPPSTIEELIFLGANVTAADTIKILLFNKSGGAINGAARNWPFLILR